MNYRNTKHSYKEKQILVVKSNDLTMFFIFQLESTIGSLVNTLQCLVCLETALKPPIFQCPEGHLLCQDCNKGIKECPKCSKPLENARNLRAEEIATKLKVL